MTTNEQIDQFAAFAKQLCQSDDGAALSLDEIYDRWRQEALGEEDLLAIQASLRDYEQGERGQPAAEVFAEIRAKRSADQSK